MGQMIVGLAVSVPMVRAVHRYIPPLKRTPRKDVDMLLESMIAEGESRLIKEFWTNNQKVRIRL